MVRTGALLLGLGAAALALVAPTALAIDLPGLFLHGRPTDQQALWTFAWYGPAVLAAAGGLLAMLAPGLAALLLAAAAAGWCAIGLSDPQFAGVPLFGPASLAGLATLLALLAAIFRRGGSEVREQVEPSSAEAAETRERELALNMDPQLVSRSEDTPAPAREIHLTLDDVTISSDEARRSSTDDIVWADEQPSRPAADRTVPLRPIFSRPVPVERPRPAAPASRWGGLVPWLVTLNAVAIVVLAVAVGYLLLQPRSDSVSVAETEPVSTAPATPPPALVAPGTATPAAVSQGSASLAEAAAPSYADPFSYCEAIGTIDRVDMRYAGPIVTGEIAKTLHVPEEASGDRVHWRCVDGEVRACSSFGWPACDVTPTAAEMLDYCRQNPTVERLLAPAGTWSCRDGKPELPEDAHWPVDDRGFLPSAWTEVNRPSPA